MQSIQSLTVISLGGGGQSSVMALMASGGAFGQLPDCAIFADTHWEPPTIYTHLDWLSRNLRFPCTWWTTGAACARTPRPSPTTPATGASSIFPYTSRDLPVQEGGTDRATAWDGGNAPSTTRSGVRQEARGLNVSVLEPGQE